MKALSLTVEDPGVYGIKFFNRNKMFSSQLKMSLDLKHSLWKIRVKKIQKKYNIF